MRLFDYMFYRIYIFYRSRGDSIADEKATNLVAIVQSLLVIDVLGIIREIFSIEIPSEYYNKWLWGLPFLLGMGGFNHYRYKKKLARDNYSALHTRWGDETENAKRRNGWLIVSSIVFVIFGGLALVIMVAMMRGREIGGTIPDLFR